MVGKEQPGQGSMLVVSERTSQFTEVDFRPPEGAAVAIQARNLHLINCLGQMASESQLSGLIRQPDTLLLAQYGTGALAVRENARRKLGRVREEARDSFFLAAGHDQTVAEWDKSANYIRAVTNGIYGEFRRRYFGHNRYYDSQRYIKQLSTQITELRYAVSQNNRQQGLRPHKVEASDDQVPSEDKASLPRQLDTRGRLIALATDPRALFLPATNQEKNMAVSFLDYLDNPEYPLGINNQLWECFVHQQKGRTAREGMSVYESKTWEIGDYLADAARSHREITKLMEASEGAYPTVTLAQEFDVSDPGIIDLIRFDAVEQYMGGTIVQETLDVLRTGEVRTVAGGSDPGKHKTIMSHFNLPADRQKAATTDYITARMQSMTIKDARQIAARALQNEYQRAVFMYSCLNDIITSLPLRESRALSRIRDAALESLGAVKDEPLVQLVADEYAQQVA